MNEDSDRETVQVDSFSPTTLPEREGSEEMSPGAFLDYVPSSIETSPLSFFYKLGLAIVAFAMVLLPLIYIGLIAVTSYGVYFHATENLVVMDVDHFSFWRLLFYLGPIIIGIILVFFMVKPFFAPVPREFESFDLDFDRQRQVYALVGRICQCVGAPPPSCIRLDNQVNASASFRSGMSSLFGNDLVLTIGLPLVAGLSAREFVGVLAHEFGHFAQGAAMRLTYVIRNINLWFSRVVYERDDWDIRLKRWTENTDFRLAIILLTAQGCVWLTRKILWALMMAGHFISCFMLRQMEFDADQYEAKLSGSDAFESTATKLHVLNAAANHTYHEIQGLWERQQLPDNLPLYFATEANKIPEHVYQQILDAIKNGKTSYLDTHPCDRDRIEAVRRLNQPGHFPSDPSASTLFTDFAELCQSLTLYHYQNTLRLKIDSNNLVPTEDAIRESEKNLEASQAIDRYFFGLASYLRPIFLGENDTLPPNDPYESVQRLMESRQSMESISELAREAHEQFGSMEDLATNALCALQLMKAGLRIKPEEFQIRTATTEAAKSVLDYALLRQTELRETLDRFDTAGRERLAASLQLLRHPQVSQSPEIEKEVLDLVRVLERLPSVISEVIPLRREFTAFTLLLRNRQPETDNPSLEKAILKQASGLHQRLKAIRSHLTGVRYPFQHAHQRITISEVALGHTVHSMRHDESAYHTSELCLDRIFGLYYRILRRLIYLAEKIETQVDGANQETPT